MSDVLTAVETRLDLILRGGRGADGALGADALARSIVANNYRKALSNASLRDPSYPLNSFDRAYMIQWTGSAEVDDPNNTTDPRVLINHTADLLVGHLAGDAHAAMLKLLGAEVALVVTQQPTARAAGDAFKICRALTWYELTGADTDPVIVRIVRGGDITHDDQFDRILTTIPLRILLSISQTAAYTP